MAAPECPAPDGSSPRQTSFSGPPPMCIDPSKTYSATMDTSLGEMVIHLDAAGAPQTVNNFVFLSRYHYYDGLTFHRIINGFVCQGGCPDGRGTGGPGYRFADELPAKGRYEVGSLADGQRRSRHQRQPVLHHHRSERCRPALRAIRCSARSSRDSRSPIRCSASRPARATSRSNPWSSTRSPSPRADAEPAVGAGHVLSAADLSCRGWSRRLRSSDRRRHRGRPPAPPVQLRRRPRGWSPHRRPGWCSDR